MWLTLNKTNNTNTDLADPHGKGDYPASAGSLRVSPGRANPERNRLGAQSYDGPAPAL